MRLKTQLALVMSVVVLLPLFALWILAAFTNSANVPGEPIMRYIRLNVLVGGTVGLDDAGDLVAKDGASVPSWLGLVVFDLGGRVVYSSLPDYAAGSALNSSALVQALDREDPNRRFIVETLMKDGRSVGSYLAVLRVGTRNFDAQPLMIVRAALAYLALLGAVGILASVVVGRLGVGVLALERSAERIAGGDLETPVHYSGPEELESLGDALERMRSSLKEEEEKRVRFIASVSHDLKTPLTSIAGYIEVLEDGLAADGASASRIFSVMKERAGTLERRISELLDFARMSRGQWRASLVRRSLGAVLAELAQGYAEDAQVLGLDWTTELESDGDDAVFLDLPLFSRALENVVGNAFRYCPAGTAVSLRCRKDGSRWLVEVEDRGPGIRAEDLERVFDPYFRGSASRREEGSGLGLYIARSIARSHGGELSVRSESGRGAAFVFALPAAGSEESGGTV